MQPDRYFHPELGFFCPAPRLRRELRVACYAALFGMAVGAAGVVIALSRTDRAADSASAVISAPTQPARVAVSRQLASTERKDVPKPAATRAPEGEPVQHAAAPSQASPLQLNKESPLQARDAEETVPLPYEFRSASATRARSYAHHADNGPDIARIPLGRPTPLENATAPNAQLGGATPAAQNPAASSAAAVAAPEAPRAVEAAAPDLPRAASVPDSKPHRMARAESRSQKPHPDNGNALANVERAYARDTTLPRTVFWDWSR